MPFDCDKFIDSGICKGDCCGMIPFNKMFWRLHRSKKDKRAKILMVAPFDNNEVLPMIKDGKCPFLCRDTYKCKIYEHRPPICKMFGTIDSLNCFLDCPYQKKDGTPRTKQEQEELAKMTDKSPEEVAHEIASQCAKNYHN